MLGRKLRTILTMVAIVLGVAMVSGTFVLTDSIDKAFGSIFTDVGLASLQMQMKDTLTAPSPNNAITVTQYRVEYVRSDGHNVEGVDKLAPGRYPFTCQIHSQMHGVLVVE